MKLNDCSSIDSTIKLLCHLPRSVWLWLKVCETVKRGLLITATNAEGPSALKRQRWLSAGLKILECNPNYNRNEKSWTGFDDTDIFQIVTSGNALLELLHKTFHTRVQTSFDPQILLSEEYIYSPAKTDQYFDSRFQPFEELLWKGQRSFLPHNYLMLPVHEQETETLKQFYRRGLPHYQIYEQFIDQLNQLADSPKTIRKIIAGESFAPADLTSPAHILLKSNIHRYIFTFSGICLSCFTEGIKLFKEYQHKPGFEDITSIVQNIRDNWKSLFDYLYETTQGAPETTNLIQDFNDMLSWLEARLMTFPRGIDEAKYEVQYNKLLQSFNTAAAIVAQSTFSLHQDKKEVCPMFPFEKRFDIIGNPRIDIPESEQESLGNALEKIVTRQRFRFKETIFKRPRKSSDGWDAEYRISESTRPTYDDYTIGFNYDKRTNTLRIYSMIPAARAKPIYEFIVERYFKIRLGTAHNSDFSGTSPTQSPKVKKAKIHSSRSSHIGETFCGLSILNDGRTLSTDRQGDFKFKGEKQWIIIDKLVEAWFDGFKMAPIGQKQDVKRIFTSTDGRRLMNFIHFEKYKEKGLRSPGGNSRYTGLACFIKDKILKKSVKQR